MSATALVSYPFTVHDSQEWDEGDRNALPLVLNHEGDTPTLFNVHLPLCPNPKRRRIIDDISGEIYYVAHTWKDEFGEKRINRCCKNSCPVCVVLNAQRIAGAIMLAEPTWWFSLTLVGECAPEIRRRVALFMHYARKKIPSLQACWAAERILDVMGATCMVTFMPPVTNAGSATRYSIMR